MAMWRKGESGNVQGRPPGTGEVGRLRAALAAHVPDIIQTMVEAAKKGDVGAAKLILERVVPALRPEERPIQLPGFAGDRIELVEAVIAAIAAGTVDLGRGGHFVSVMAPSEFEQRIAELERKIKTERERGSTLLVEDAELEGTT